MKRTGREKKAKKKKTKRIKYPVAHKPGADTVHRRVGVLHRRRPLSGARDPRNPVQGEFFNFFFRFFGVRRSGFPSGVPYVSHNFRCCSDFPGFAGARGLRSSNRLFFLITLI